MDEKSNTQEHLIAFAKRKKTLIVLTFSFFLVFIVVATVIMITMGGSNYQSSKMPEEYMDGIRYLKNSLKDPKSMVICGDIYVTEMGKLDDSMGISIMVGIKYNANNAFGALNGVESGTLYLHEDNRWEYYSIDNDYYLGLAIGLEEGKTAPESDYNAVHKNLEGCKRQLEQIKSGKADADEEDKTNLEEAYEKLLKEKEYYHVYNGKKVAKALGCEYYEYK